MRTKNVMSNDDIEHIAEHIVICICSKEMTKLIKNFTQQPYKNCITAPVILFEIFKFTMNFSIHHPKTAYNLLKLGLSSDTSDSIKISKILASKLSNYSKLSSVIHDNKACLTKIENICKFFKIITDDDPFILQNIIKTKYATVFLTDLSIIKISLQAYSSDKYLDFITLIMKKFVSEKFFRKNCIELMHDVKKDIFNQFKIIDKLKSDAHKVDSMCRKQIFFSNIKKLNEPLTSLLDDFSSSHKKIN